MSALSASEASSFFHESFSFFVGKGIEADVVDIHGVGVFSFALIVLRRFLG